MMDTKTESPTGVPVQRMVRPRYRLCDWVDTETYTPVFGIQREVALDKWLNCAIRGKPLLYTKLETAERHCNWLNDPNGTEPDWSQDQAA